MISLAGVAIGVGPIFAFLIFSISRNPIISNLSIRWSFIGSSLVEVSGSIGSVYSLLPPYAFISLSPILQLFFLLTYFDGSRLKNYMV